jgi:eukaryotic-like serine/threonine-protein kinase
VTDPQNSYWQNPLSYDPLGREPAAPPPTGPPALAPPPSAPPRRRPVNELATMSLLFAFVFAPVGAILGHRGLAQIRRTGEPGRGRALAGVALSYAFISLAVVALVSWAIVTPATSSQNAQSPTSTSAAPGAAPPTVAPDTVATLLPGLDALKVIADDQNLEAGSTWDKPASSDQEGAIDRPECWGSIAPGTPDAYTEGIAGYRAQEFTDTRTFLKSIQIIEGVAAFRDAPTAQSQLAQLLAGWRQCGGTTVTATMPNGQPIPFSVGVPADAGNGITTLDLTPKGIQVRSARAIAAKANVIVDLLVSSRGSTDSERPRLASVSIANAILGKIPG